MNLSRREIRGEENKENKRENDSEKRDNVIKRTLRSGEKLLVAGVVSAGLVLGACGSAKTDNMRDSGTEGTIGSLPGFEDTRTEDSVSDLIDEDVIEDTEVGDVPEEMDAPEDLIMDSAEDSIEEVDVETDVPEDVEDVDAEGDVSADSVEDAAEDSDLDAEWDTAPDTVDEDVSTDRIDVDTLDAGDVMDGDVSDADMTDAHADGLDAVEDSIEDGSDLVGDTGSDTVSDIVEDETGEDMVSDVVDEDTGMDVVSDLGEDVISDLIETDGSYCSTFDDTITAWIVDGDSVDVGGLVVEYGYDSTAGDGVFDIYCDGVLIEGDKHVATGEYHVMDIIDYDVRVTIDGHVISPGGTTSTITVHPLAVSEPDSDDVIGDAPGDTGPVLCSAVDDVFYGFIYEGSTEVVGNVGVKYKGTDTGGIPVFDILCDGIPIRTDISTPLFTPVSIDIPEQEVEITMTTMAVSGTNAYLRVEVDSYY